MNLKYIYNKILFFGISEVTYEVLLQTTSFVMQK